MNAAAPSPSNSRKPGPLDHRTFRGLLLCSVVFFIGNGMQVMAAAWYLVEHSHSALLAALVQTAVFLPMFALGLPAGVLADTTDRGRLMKVALAVQTLACAVLSVGVLMGWTSPISVLLFVFACGCCIAVMTPAWNSSVVDTLPREMWPQAITAVSISYNAARAIGPSLAGLIFAKLGAEWVFAATIFTSLVMWQSIRVWPPRMHPPSRLPVERLWAGTVSGLRFAWHSRLILAQLIRVMAYSSAGSALWALLPTIAHRQLGTGAQGFGLLMGCLGCGGIATGLVIGQLRQRFSLDAIVSVACVVFACVMLLAAWTDSHTLIYFAMMGGGAAWMAAMSTFNTATQSSVPQWVRSRAVALHIVVSLGSYAVGSAVWGAVSEMMGLSLALTIAAVVMAAGLLLVYPLPLRFGELQEITQGTPWDELFVKAEPSPEAGPVAVEISYRIRGGTEASFLDTISGMKAPRRRDGAIFWRIYKDLGEPTRYVERFIVDSWAAYLHQRARATVADHELEANVRAFLAPGESVHTSHYVAER